MLLHWIDDLGSPAAPGEISVPNFGVLTITQRHIDIAKEHDGRVSFDAEDVTATDDVGRRQYLLKGLAHPD